eukprot:290594-Hanusia_phi.AAC.2
MSVFHLRVVLFTRIPRPRNLTSRMLHQLILASQLRFHDVEVCMPQCAFACKGLLRGCIIAIAFIGHANLQDPIAEAQPGCLSQ